MQPNILVQSLGESANLKILGFFLERPFIAFRQNLISNFLGISRDTVRKHIHYFEDKNILVRIGDRGPYKLNRNHPIIAVYEEYMEKAGNALLKYEQPEAFAEGEFSQIDVRAIIFNNIEKKDAVSACHDSDTICLHGSA